MQVNKERHDRAAVRDNGGHRRSVKPQPRETEPSEHQQGVQHGGQSEEAALEVQRRLGVPGSSEHGGYEEHSEHERHRPQEYPQVAGRHRQHLRRRADDPQQVFREQLTHQNAAQPDDAGQHRRVPDHALQLRPVLRAVGLGDEDIRGHGEAARHRHEDEEHRKAHRDRRHRGRAQAVADPDRVDDAVRRVQRAAGEHRHGEGDQMPGDAARGQIAAVSCEMRV